MSDGWRGSLARLLLRNRTLRRGLLPLLLGATVGWSTFGLLLTMSLSPEQSVEAAYGNADGQTTVAREIQPGEPFPAFTVPDTVLATAPALLAAVAWQQDSGEVIDTTYSEVALPSFATDGRLELVAGRWPEVPGEVATAPGFPASVGSELQPRVGWWPLRVVGIVQDRYQSNGRTVHGHPGTWALWRMTPEEATLGGFSADPSLYWRASDPSGASRAVQEANPLGSGEQGSDAVTLRRARSQPSARDWLESGFLAFGLPVAGAVVGGALLGRWLRRISRPLTDVGLPGRAIVSTQTLTITAAMTASLLAAVPLTYLVVWLGRPLAASPLTHPPHPWSWLVPQVGPSVITALLAGTLATLATSRSRSGSTPVIRRPLGTISQRALRIGGLVTAALALVIFWGGDRSFITISNLTLLLAVCAGCAAPGVLAALARVPFGPGRRLAGTRSLRSGLGSYAPFAFGGIVLTAVCASGLALVGGGIASGNARSSSGFPPGMALVNTDSAAGVLPEHLVSEFETDIGLPPGRTLWQSVDLTGARPLVTWTFTGSADVAAILGPLDQGQQETLAMGQPLQAVVDESAVSPAPARTIQVAKDLRRVTMVRVAATRPPDSISTSLAYAGLTRTQDQMVYEWADRHGVQPAFISTTSQGSPVPIPLTTQFAAIGFGGVIALLSALLLRNEVALLRPRLAGFNALGLGSHWVKGIVLTIGLGLGLVITLLSLLAVLLTALATKVIVGDLRLAGVPWIGVSLILLGPLIGGLLGALLATRRLRPVDRKM